MADDQFELIQGGGSGKDAALLKEIRERYAAADAAWRPLREERRTDMRYVCGDPWSEKDRKAREDAFRPCISHDELSQYVNAVVNNARQNKRGIKFSPSGAGADDNTAMLREDLVRTIEYRSQAQSAYITAYQQCVEGSYGFFRLSRKYVSDQSFDQEIVVKAIPNPDSVLYDPDVREADWSDAQYCFLVEPLTREEFKRRWPKARIQDFGFDAMRLAKDWISERNVLTAEYWRVESKPGNIYLLKDGSLSTDPKDAGKAVKSRDIERKCVVQYFTNGVEILERNEQPGTLLPIIPCAGIERYVDNGDGAKRVLFSLIRLAREPQMTLAYLCSQQMEEASLSPKATFIGYTGQFETDSEAWETINKIPHARVQADPVVDGATGAILPLPTRIPFTPNFQAYEVAKDSARRAIQAAMGISPLPTAAQRQNEKSGVALERIDQAQQLGSYGFADNFERALCYAGRVMDEWIPVVYDSEREMALHRRDDSHEMVQLNTPEPYVDPKSNEEKQYDTSAGDHHVTISAAPSYQSQREEAASFLDTLIQNLKGLPLAPPQAQHLLSLAIRMRQLGPLGDQMAEIIDPTANGNGQQQQLAAQQQQMAQMQQQFQQMQAELQKLQLERAGKVLDNQAKLQIAQMQIEAGIAEAEIETKAQQQSERAEFVGDMAQQFHAQAHEAAMQGMDQAHDRQLTDQQAANQQDLQAQGAQQQAQQAAQQQQQGDTQA